MNRILTVLMVALVTIGLGVSTAQAEECPKHCPKGQRIARWCRCTEGCTPKNQICRCVDNTGYLKKKISVAEAEIVRLNGEAARLAREGNLSQAEVSRLKAEVERLTAEVASLKEQVGDESVLRARIVVLDGEIGKLKAEVERLTADNAKLREENKALKGPHSLQLSLEYMSALRVVDPPATCTGCSQRKSFPMAATIGLKYEFHLAHGIVGLAPLVLLRVGGDDDGNPFGGAGLGAELSIFPEPKRIFKLVLDVAGFAEGNASKTAFNFECGFGLGAMWAPGIGFVGGVRYALHALNEQHNVPFVFFQIIVAIPTKSNHN